MATKKELEAMLAALQAQVGQPVAPVVAAPVVASLATIPAAAWETLRDTFASVSDTKGRDATLRSTLLSFGEQVPAELKGKPVPLAIAEDQAKLVAAKFAPSAEALAAMTEEQRKRATLTLTQLKSRATSLFQCAAILPVAISQGFSGGVQETSKLCTALKKGGFDLAKVLEARKAEADAPKDYGAYLAQTMAGALNAKGEIKALSAKAKAQLVVWCDEWGIKPKHAEEYRNPALARGE